MPRLSLLPVMAREIFGPREFPREPEPAMIMDDAQQVSAYSDAGRADGTLAASYLFNTGHISQVIQGCAQVLDLGCGPATQLAQVAGINPDISFVGVDLSPSMLASARAHLDAEAVHNVSLREGDITRLPGIADRSMDAVISTLTLHHLPSLAHLESCFREIARVLRPGGRLYIVDFTRLKSLKSVLFFAYMNARHQPHIVSLDYERSLRAAFMQAELADMARAYLPDTVRSFSTFQVPLLAVLKTPSTPLTPALREKLAALRARLPRRYQRDLDELRLFFRLGGLDNDPFARPH